MNKRIDMSKARGHKLWFAIRIIRMKMRHARPFHKWNIWIDIKGRDFSYETSLCSMGRIPKVCKGIFNRFSNYRVKYIVRENTSQDNIMLYTLHIEED